MLQTQQSHSLKKLKNRKDESYLAQESLLGLGRTFFLPYLYHCCSGSFTHRLIEISRSFPV